MGSIVGEMVKHGKTWVPATTAIAVVVAKVELAKLAAATLVVAGVLVVGLSR